MNLCDEGVEGETKKWKYHHFYAFLISRRLANVTNSRFSVNDFLEPRSIGPADAWGFFSLGWLCLCAFVSPLLASPIIGFMTICVDRGLDHGL